MKTFKPMITLSENSRGCWILDTVKGCSACKVRPSGCYDDCYAKKIASRYNIYFASPVVRETYNDNGQLYFLDFHSAEHINKIIRKIKEIDMPFIRIGEMGDPSEDWEHTVRVCSVLSVAQKPIVIITKHWKSLSDSSLQEIRMMNVCINTSISALDSSEEIEHRLRQYKRLKKYCRSVLRIVSCDFNLNNEEGLLRHKVQKELFKNEHVIDTVFRPSAQNRLVIEEVINTKKVKFLGATMLASMYKNDAYLGMCKTCPDMCGVA